MNRPWVYMCSPSWTLPTPHLFRHPIPQGHPTAPALSTLSYASNLDWRSISHMIIHMLQCYSLKSHPRLLPQSPTVCSLHLCLFCCHAYRVIIGARLFKAYVRLSRVTTNSSGHHFHVLYMIGIPRAQYNTSGAPWSYAVNGSLPLYFLSFLRTQRWLI